MGNDGISAWNLLINEWNWNVCNYTKSPRVHATAIDFDGVDELYMKTDPRGPLALA